jgi:type VI protein secretion system component VasK
MSHAVNTPNQKDRTGLFRWIAGGFSAATIVTALTIAVWPASAAETAKADGQAVGQAVSDLYYADNATEVDNALDDLHVAVADSHEHATGELDEQIDKQADALDRAADGYVGSVTSDDEFEADLYQAELDYALDDLASQADDFRTHGPEVVQSFWDGVDEGLAL